MEGEESRKPRSGGKPSEKEKSRGRRPDEPSSSEQPRLKIRKTETPSTSRESSSSKSIEHEPGPSTSRRGSVSRGSSTTRQERGAGDAPRRARQPIYELIHTRPSSIGESKRGTSGDQIALQANYFRLMKKPAWNIYRYHVDFSPEIESRSVRKGVLSESKSLLHGYIFDGATMFTITKLEGDVVELNTTSKSGVEYKINIKFVGIISMAQSESLQVLNSILRFAMHGLKLQLVGRNFFDPEARIDIREHRLQMWPGYMTSIRQHETDILLCAEIAHKIMRTETLYQILQCCIKDSRGDYRDSFRRKVLGTTVLTDYNNRTYRIDDVNFEENPQSTFPMKDKKISFMDYYYQKYHIRIQDGKQPLLISKAKAREIRGGQSELIVLIPELCRPTGLNDEMRENNLLMKSMSAYTRMRPDTRIERLKTFNRRLQETEASVSILRNWNMTLDKHLVELTGRHLRNENIVFGDNKKVATSTERADWQLRDVSMYTRVELRNWAVILTVRSQREIRNFIECLIKVANGMNMKISQPRQVSIYDDRNHTYVGAIEDCARNDPQLIMCIVPNNNAERYATIKKKACVDRAIPTQVIVQRTASRPKGLMSIATKVAVQLNCKLGGAAWMIELPLSGLMTIGYDIARSTRDKSKSYGALVATLDMKASPKFFSAVSLSNSTDQLSSELTVNVMKALQYSKASTGTLPKQILIYRDAVGDGQIKQVLELEVQTLVERLKQVYKDANAENEVRLAFIIVSKKINTRFFKHGRNPDPGTVVDDIVTLPERYDFYLVSQFVGQGSVSPTSYNVIYDTMRLPPDRMQVLTYKMTHLYYNWTATTRVPAVCQYAKKLATLVATSLHQSPSNLLEKQLYFL